METSQCYRTTRISDAGEDLAYLYFVQNGGTKSLRLEGFVTSEIERLAPDPLHYSGRIKSPVADVVVEAELNGVARYSQTDSYGRFVFDGLTERDYHVTVFNAEFPNHAEKLSGPKPVQLKAGRCALTTLLVLRHSSG